MSLDKLVNYRSHREILSPQNMIRANEMALRIKELAAKSDALSLIPETYVVERENQLPINYPWTSKHMLQHANHVCKLPSDLHTHATACKPYIQIIF